MSAKSNNQGRAYEYACLINLYDEVAKNKNVKIVENTSFNTSKKAWQSLDLNNQKLYKKSALAGTLKLTELEPLILSDNVELLIQSDECGKMGDVRDILIVKKDINWEIGLSVKHNHFAVKHSRLSKQLDFGKKWYSFECSCNYWNEIKPIFDFLESQKGMKWRDLVDKEDKIYMPLLNAFRNEILHQYNLNNKKIAESMTKYLLGEFDFYKLISIDNKQATEIQAHNLRGKLGKNGIIAIPLLSLPTRIISFDFKSNSKNTLELYLDNGW